MSSEGLRARSLGQGLCHWLQRPELALVRKRLPTATCFQGTYANICHHLPGTYARRYPYYTCSCHRMIAGNMLRYVVGCSAASSSFLMVMTSVLYFYVWRSRLRSAYLLLPRPLSSTDTRPLTPPARRLHLPILHSSSPPPASIAILPTVLLHSARRLSHAPTQCVTA